MALGIYFRNHGCGALQFMPIGHFLPIRFTSNGL